MENIITRQQRRASDRRVVRLSLSKADRRRLFRVPAKGAESRTARRRALIKAILSGQPNQ